MIRQPAVISMENSVTLTVKIQAVWDFFLFLQTLTLKESGGQSVHCSAVWPVFDDYGEWSNFHFFPPFEAIEKKFISTDFLNIFCLGQIKFLLLKLYQKQYIKASFVFYFSNKQNRFLQKLELQMKIKQHYHSYPTLLSNMFGVSITGVNGGTLMAIGTLK